MSESATDEFLDLYRRLETAAETVVGSNGRGSTVYRLEQHPDFAAYSDTLDCIREVRYLLSHEPKIGGDYPIHPGEGMLQELRDILTQIEDPPCVKDRMTPVEELITADRETPVLPLMASMQKRHISHVPVLDGKRVDSVFSVGTVFQAALDGTTVLNENTRIRDFAAYLPLDRHTDQEFRFVVPTLPLREARDLFDRAYQRQSKLRLLLVTKNARPEAPLLGVLSPYDLLK